MEPQGSPSGLIDKVTETWVTAPERPVSLSGRNACLVHIYPTGPSMGRAGEGSKRDRGRGRSPVAVGRSLER